MNKKQKERVKEVREFLDEVHDDAMEQLFNTKLQRAITGPLRFLERRRIRRKVRFIEGAHSDIHGLMDMEDEVLLEHSDRILKMRDLKRKLEEAAGIM